MQVHSKNQPGVFAIVAATNMANRSASCATLAFEVSAPERVLCDLTTELVDVEYDRWKILKTLFCNRLP
jgi:hypothetical protein